MVKEFEQEVSQMMDAMFENEMKKVNDMLEQDLLISLIGEVNAGKSSTVNKIIGEDIASTNPMPGETISVDPYNIRGLENIKFMDTPGLNDPNDENPKKTLEFVQNSDVVLFFLNAAGTVFSESEKEKFTAIEKHNKDILIVLNKIDAAENIPSIVQFVKDHTKNKYKVIPISSKTGENLENLKKEILFLLEKKGKDLLFAKSMKEKSSAANRWIIGAGVSAGVIGASPIPGSDVIPLTSLQVGMIIKLSKLYDKPLSKKAAKDMIVVTATQTIGHTLYRQALKFIPGAGSVIGGTVASAMTLALGYGVKYAYENNMAIDYDMIGDLFEKYRAREKKA
ncbi:small GTP-binding protein [Planococcus glaciei]|uniref:GTP-binding protein n=1 Tax=Planococcus glaciei TaxID=459472 RepID=A0A1G7W988_9BACL|nr:GTPase [Planococcus glaciei]MCP2033947.1 GTP-binding protein Era [Planomicrobium sp. HSC-17F08]ETP69223.1 small GTP-binding protein [Planococcus glaciei CHR43]KOF12090.1 small GTP-binding protein [Planococcus glaciei]MBX0314471.1 50S ribosome-binding GTPase [Planococcus glaciei]QKX49875.1 GTP-binding protein [Planococcus glaciei]